MSERRDPSALAAGTLRTQAGWLLVLLIAAGGVVLALIEVWLWLVFATGVLAAFAVIGLVRPRAESASTSFFRHAESGWSYLRTELARSRRHDRRFALVALPDDLWAPESVSGDEKIDRGLEAVTTVQSLVRRPDRAWIDVSRLYLVLTECDRQQGLAFLARARAAMPQLFGDDRVKLAVFPDDGITSGALLSALEPSTVPAAEAEPSGGAAQ